MALGRLYNGGHSPGRGVRSFVISNLVSLVLGPRGDQLYCSGLAIYWVRPRRQLTRAVWLQGLPFVPFVSSNLAQLTRAAHFQWPRTLQTHRWAENSWWGEVVWKGELPQWSAAHPPLITARNSVCPSANRRMCFTHVQKGEEGICASENGHLADCRVCIINVSEVIMPFWPFRFPIS
jgi:hypothetical protein